MKQTVDAVCEGGMFRPVAPVDGGLTERQRVRLVVETTRPTPEEILELAGRVFEGLSEEEIQEIEDAILNNRVHFEERVAERLGR